MELYWKVMAGALITLVLTLCLAREERTMGVLLALAMSVMTAMAAVSYLKPVFSFLENLNAMAALENTAMAVLLKVAGISLVGRIATQICTDCGNGALGKALEFLCGGTVMWLSLPVWEAMLSLLAEILEGI